jgi:ubiquinone/menaquinone biosynthesis C-methylase UbiE
MDKSCTVTDYDGQFKDFDSMRMPSPLIVRELKKILARLPNDKPILSVGCGTGQYEEALNLPMIVGLDKSQKMLEIAAKRVKECILGNMVNIPFDDNTFGGIYFIQSFHHCGANFEITQEERTQLRMKALREAYRVLECGPIVIVQRDPSQNQAIWFWKYFPKALEKKLIIQPCISDIKNWLEEIGFVEVTAFPIDDPMIKGFYNETAPLDKKFQNAFSEFSYLSNTELKHGESLLLESIHKGTVKEDIRLCQEYFKRTGGTVYMITAYKK